ncbi:MAG: carboxy terminal-processing peptidase [Saprospiraceae bacterium]|jgi:carboxyl-terminal processing protease
MKLKGLLLTLIVSSGLLISAVVPGINPAKERLILNAVINYLDALHLDPVKLDDEFSAMAFDNCIKLMDSGKRFYIQDEVNYLNKYKKSLDEQVSSRTFDFFNEAETIINHARERAENIFYEIIDSDLSEISAENLEMDVDKRNFAKDEEDLRLLWKKIIKYDFNVRLKSKIESQDKKIEEFESSQEESLEKPELKSREELEAEVIEAIKKSYKNLFDNLGKLRRSDYFESYINAITHTYDPHSDYMTPKSKEDFDIQMGGKLEGIGARLSTQDELTKVVSIVPGGPAWKGKELEVDDLITAVTQEGEEPLNIMGMRLDDVVQKIRGKKGTRVTLTVKKADGTMKDIEIERDEVIIDESFARSLILDLEGSLNNVGYIRLPKFYSTFEKEDGNSCAKDVKIEIEKLKEQDVSGIILDLRNNGGGSLRDVIDMTGLFIEDGPIVQVKPREKEAYVYEDEDAEVHFTGPLIVLVNQFSASASEILAAALQDYNRAVIIGSNSTFGKGTVQRFIDLDRAYRDYEEIKPLGNLKITMQKFYRIDGGSTQLKGVIPDVILPDSYHYIETGEKDFDNAVEWTEIPSVEFEQDIYQVANKQSLVQMSQERISKDENFKLILENAERLKRNQDQSVYPLDYERFSKLKNDRDAEAKKYEGIYENDIEALVARNLEVDMDYINLDESRVARNEEWIKSIKKDIYLEEALLVLRDMLQQEKDLVHIKK